MRKWKHQRKYQAVLLAGSLLAAAPDVHARDDSGPLQPVTLRKGVISGDVRFMVNGPSRAENVEVAGWADEVYSRMAGLLNQSLVRNSAERLIQINLTYDPDGDTVVTTRQYNTDAGFIQELNLRNVNRENQDEAVEVLCRLLLERFSAKNGYPVNWQNTNKAFPGWLVYGIASHFSAPQRNANRMVVVDAWKKEENLHIGKVLREELPYIQQRAAEGEFFEWIADRPDRQRIFDAVLQRKSPYSRTNEVSLLCDIMGYANMTQAVQQWDLHLVSLQNVVLAPGRCMPEDLDNFAERLQVPSVILSTATGKDIQGTYPLSALIAYRYENWMPQVCQALSLRIQESVVGKARELQNVAGIYKNFLDMLSDSQKDDALFRETTVEQLEDQLMKAETAFKELEYKVKTGQIKPLSATLTAEPQQESGKE